MNMRTIKATAAGIAILLKPSSSSSFLFSSQRRTVHTSKLIVPFTHNNISNNYNIIHNYNLYKINKSYSTSLTLHMSSSSSSATPNIQQIQKSQLEDIIEQIRTNGREESGYVIIDVRNVDEIRMTGKLDECVETLPLPFIAAEGGAFSLEPEEFEEKFGFVKPSPDETLVLSCKAGIRSMHAAYFASLNGYTQLVNYSGGADDWFGGVQGW